MIWPLTPVVPPQIVIKFHSAPAFIFELFLQIVLAFLLWTGLNRLRNAVNERTAISLQSGQRDLSVPATSNTPRQYLGKNDVDRNSYRNPAGKLEGSRAQLTVSTSNTETSSTSNVPRQALDKCDVAVRKMPPTIYSPLSGTTITPPIRITPPTPPGSPSFQGTSDEDSTDWEDAEELQEATSSAQYVEPAEDYAKTSSTPTLSFRPISLLELPAIDVTALTTMPPSKGVSTTDRTCEESSSSSRESLSKCRRSRSLSNVEGISAHFGVSAPAQKWQYDIRKQGPAINWPYIQKRGISAENWARHIAQKYPQVQSQPSVTFWGTTRELENSWTASQDSLPDPTAAHWNAQQRHHTSPNVRRTQILEMDAMRSWVPPASYPAGAYGMMDQLAQRHHSLKEMLGHNISKSTYSVRDDTDDDEEEDDLDE